MPFDDYDFQYSKLKSDIPCILGHCKLWALCIWDFVLVKAM
jgi:hypothetical protein